MKRKEKIPKELVEMAYLLKKATEEANKKIKELSKRQPQ